jgi:magnesium transporter
LSAEKSLPGSAAIDPGKVKRESEVIMAFLSDIIHRPVIDLNGGRVGTLEDVIATTPSEYIHPKIVGVVIRTEHGELVIPYSDLAVLLAPAIPLSRRMSEISSYTPGAQDFYLVEDVLDKQIIDTDDIRVVRVNDVELVRINGAVIASNVEIGALGLIRRVGLEGPVVRISSLFRRPIHPVFISWDDVELLPSDRSGSGQMVRLKTTKGRISELHPADLADILADMNHEQSEDLLETMDIEQVADTLEEAEPEVQASLIGTMSDERVADILEEMSPDAAADLLAELSEERSEDLLELMDREDADDVRKLLAYPEESAGGLMTPSFVAVPVNMTAEQAIAFLRENASEAETIFYVYVTDDVGHLKGVFSLSDLILARQDTPVTDFMHKRVVSVSPQDSQEEVARVVARYNLLAVPVLDENDTILGIVTSDDALDKIIPTAWKKRLPRFFR